MLGRLGSLILAIIVVASAGLTVEAATTLLHEGWSLQSGCTVTAGGQEISSPAFKPAGWDQITVPSTVLAAQVAAGKYKDPYYAKNLREIPGTSYPIGDNFSNLPMPPDSPYHCSWWYRKQFFIPTADQGRTLWLHFSGINYRANIWLNGRRIADSDHVAGAYRTYDFEVTQAARPGRANMLAVETFAPTETDLGVNWVDWNPCPPDKDMGLTGAVALTTSGPVSVRSPLVTTHFPSASLGSAQLTIYGELHNASASTVHGVASASLLGLRLEQPIELAPGEDKTVIFSPEKYPQLNVAHPQVWWPYQMGSPHLEMVSVGFTERGKLSDEQSARFGVREVTSELTDKGYRLFRVNGNPVLIRGAGWSQDMLLREDPERLEKQFDLVQDMHLNTIRLEGKLETEDFYRLADERGILVMAGWCCCDQWEHWEKWTPENLSVATASLRDQMLRVRHHASLLVWLNGSDNPPPANVERAYLDVEAQTHWPNPALSSASARSTDVSGGSGVKMTGPYDFVAPSYWLVDKNKYGGAYGFNTETGPGAAIPNIASLRKFIPADHMWPPDDVWSFHYGGEGFQKLEVFRTAMDATYGPTASLAEYERVAQTMAYDGERAMFEAYGRNKYVSTGVIQWMLNNAWPSMIWHLYDYYLDVGGGYFGAKKACEPLHVQYSYDNHSVYVVNSTYEPTPKLHVSAHVYDTGLKQLFAEDADVDVASDSSIQALAIPDSVFATGAGVSFVRLTLTDQTGQIGSENFYWVPSKLTEFDWAKTDYTHTPALTHEDMTALRSLPPAKITAEWLPGKAQRSQRVRLRNPSDALAFQVSLAAFDASGDAVTPAFWSDNYIELMPGESRLLTVTLPPGSRAVAIAVSGWNVAPQTLKRAPERSIAKR